MNRWELIYSLGRCKGKTKKPSSSDPSNLKSTPSFAELFSWPPSYFSQGIQWYITIHDMWKGWKDRLGAGPNLAFLKKQGVNFELIELNGYSTDFRFLFTVPYIYSFQVGYTSKNLLIWRVFWNLLVIAVLLKCPRDAGLNFRLLNPKKKLPRAVFSLWSLNFYCQKWSSHWKSRRYFQQKMKISGKCQRWDKCC